MNYRLIADTHFAASDRLSVRSRNRQDQQWAALRPIPAEDIRIHLGDVCVHRDKEVHARLNKDVVCRRVLVRGNRV
jgi:hypothetical protein